MSEDKSNQIMFRSINELEDSSDFREFLTREFPEGAENAPDGVTRRRWIQLMGASAVLAGVSGCRFENKKITPYTFRPEDRVPGETRTFASTVEWAGSVRPLYLTSYDGRPIKVDGNAAHPLTSALSQKGSSSPKGASDTASQASILDLYDPDRSRGCLQKVGRKFEEATWEDFQNAVGGLHLDHGFVVVAEPSTSVATANLKKKLLAKYPETKWFEYAPLNNDNEAAGLKAAFGKSLRAHYDFSEAEVIVSLDSDFMHEHPTAISNAAGWAASRTAGVKAADHGEAGSRPMSRLYSIESQYSLTGVNSDHRWPIKSAHVASFAENLRQQVDKVRAAGAQLPVEGSLEEQRVAILANELVFGINTDGNSKGRTVVVVGPNQPASVHQLAAVINEAVASKLVSYSEVAESAGSLESIRSAVEYLESGSAETLLLIGGNPVYDAPGDVGFESAMQKAEHRIHFSLSQNETTDECTWHLNQGHPFEVWSDSVAYDGSRGIGQPLIEPLFGAKSTAELLSILVGEPKPAQELVREVFADLDDKNWLVSVHSGFVNESSVAKASVSGAKAPSGLDPKGWLLEDETLELVFTTSQLHDGRLANNGWLQELPDALTKVTWDNPLIVGPKTAERLKARQNEKMKVTVEGQVIEAPVFIQPGQAEGSIGIAVGYGRKKAGQVGGSIEKKIPAVGVSAQAVRRTTGWGFASDVSAAGTGARERLASTQDHHQIDLTGKKEIGDRWSRLIYEDTFDSYQHFADEQKKADKEESDHGHGHHAQWPGHHHLHFENVDPIPRSWDYDVEHKWGMTIDLNKCTGCGACVVACQSENNIGVVGKDQVSRGRELHWIRIDRYMAANKSFADAGKILDDPEPRIRTQPVTCHHCENAPCEQVCPVAATVHSDEGLNDMVYNRCIGTRYCGNNCPYKVRRFNYLNYSDATTLVKYPWADKYSQEDLKVRSLVMNPEVTIRSRGVMEKCSYCVQRIQNTKIKARAEHREIGSNEITTACQDCCPTAAIEFGNLADPKSRVAQNQADVRSYIMLEELNIGQRTKYMARVTNPNPAWPVPVLDGSGKLGFASYKEANGAHALEVKSSKSDSDKAGEKSESSDQKAKE